MKNKKTWLILSLSCILSGIVLTAAGLLLGGIPGFYLDKNGIHTAHENTVQTMEVFQDTLEPEAFDRMELRVKYADVTLIPSDRYAVEYRIPGTFGAPVCNVEDGRLSFHEDPVESGPRIWFLYATPNSAFTRKMEPGPYYVKVEYPADTVFSEITVTTESGDLSLPDLHADTLDIRDEYGDVTLDALNGQTLTIHMSSGNLSLGNIQTDRTEIRSEYGNVTLDTLNGQALTIRMSSGNLSLDKVRTGQTDLENEYGNILIGQASGDRMTADLSSGYFMCSRTDFADIHIKDEYGPVQLGLPGDISAYGYSLHTEYGFLRMDDTTLGSEADDDGITYISRGSIARNIEIFCENGDIIIQTVP